MTTLRIAKRRQYVNLDSRAVNDDRLSFRARGVLAWLLEKPDSWTVNANAIAARGAEGRDAIRTALAELEHAGYLRRRKWRGDDGKFHSEHVVFEHPSLAVENVGDDGDNPAHHDGKPALVNRTGFSGALVITSKNQNADDAAPPQNGGAADAPKRPPRARVADRGELGRLIANTRASIPRRRPA